MIQFELQKKKGNVIQFAVRDNLDLEIMKEFEKRILAEKFPKSRKKTNQISVDMQSKCNRCLSKTKSLQPSPRSLI